MEDSIYRTEMLSVGGFVPVNKILIRALGLHNAVFICELCTKKLYFHKEGNLVDGGFFNTEANREFDMGLSPKQQRKCVKDLVANKILRVKRRGIPAKQWFYLNEKRIFDVIKKQSEMERQVVPKGRTGYDKKTNRLGKKDQLINKKNIIKINNKKEEGAENFSFYIKLSYKTFLKNFLKKSDIKTALDLFSAADPPFFSQKVKAEHFALFWDWYPRKLQINQAQIAWNKLSYNKDKPTVQEILSAIVYQMDSSQWKKGSRWIAYPTKWIENRLWSNDPASMVDHSSLRKCSRGKTKKSVSEEGPMPT